MKELFQVFPVKIQLLIPFFGPSPAAAAEVPALIENIIGIRVSAILRIKRIGKRVPVKFLLSPEARLEKVLSLFRPFLQCEAPDFRKQVFPSALFIGGCGRLGQPVSSEHTKGGKHLFIRHVLRCPEPCQCRILLQHGRICKGTGCFRRQVMEHSVFQHPSPQVFPHGGISDAAVEKARLKGPHFLQAVLRRAAPDAAKQFVQVEIRQRGCDRAVLPLPDAGTPGEIPPQLPDIEIVIGREILSDIPGPGSVVLVVLHEPALADEVPALMQIGAVSVLIQLHHLADALRHLRSLKLRPFSDKWQGGFPVYRLSVSESLVLLIRYRDRVQDDGIALPLRHIQFCCSHRRLFPPIHLVSPVPGSPVFCFPAPVPGPNIPQLPFLSKQIVFRAGPSDLPCVSSVCSYYFRIFFA